MTNIRVLGLGVIALAIGCGDSKGAASAARTRDADGRIALTGAGATFANPIYTKWIHEYDSTTGVKINYQSIGSGGGIRQIAEQTVDFGATDSPMTDDDMVNAKGGSILHFPTVLGAAVISYNVPSLSRSLNLTGTVIAEIYLGRITRWNDTRIATLNPGIPLPSTEILVVHRSDGSGTTFVFTDYLSAVSPEWARVVGRGKEVKWPIGLGAKGNEGVSGQVKQTPGSIGYAELTYARQNRLPFANVRNIAGTFIEPTVETITAAANGLALPTDYRVSIVNKGGANAYPISSFTWLLVYREQTDTAKGRRLKEFMRWIYTEGEKTAATLDYGPLPADLAKRLLARLDSIHTTGAK